jgi:hypothetical protein
LTLAIDHRRLGAGVAPHGEPLASNVDIAVPRPAVRAGGDQDDVARGCGVHGRLQGRVVTGDVHNPRTRLPPKGKSRQGPGTR